MVRKSQRQKNTAVQHISTHSDKSDNETNDDGGLKCKYCDVVSANIKEKQKHEQACDAQASANVFITSDGKLRFLCTVSKYDGWESGEKLTFCLRIQIFLLWTTNKYNFSREETC